MRNSRRCLPSTVMLMVLLHDVLFCSAAFIEVPSSVIIETGSGEALFRCCHESPGAVIGWTVNGSSLEQFSDIATNTVNENGARVSTLTIPSRSEYNRTYIVCVAFLFDQSMMPESTPPVTLIITAPSFAVTMPPTTAPPSATTVLTTIPPTSGQADFELAPSPLTVAVEQGKATFQCRHSRCDGINWRVNGILLNWASLPNISLVASLRDGNVTYILSIGTLLEYDQATIECVAFFLSGLLQFTAPVKLFIQDTPGKVKNASYERDYSSSALTTSWNPLPTLDINGTNPDIVYTIELFKITCDQQIPISLKVVAESSATEENLDLMQIYMAVISAKNNVITARNGPSVEIREHFALLDQILLSELARKSQVNFTKSEPVPNYYTMILESLDGLGHNFIINITVERSEDMIHMTTEESLPSKSLWNATVLPYGCETDTVVNGIELSTHDIQNVTVDSPQPNVVRVKGDFVDQARATGALLIIYSLSEDSNVHYFKIDKTSEEYCNIDVNVTIQTGIEYGISVFALEDGLPFPRVVSLPKDINVASNITQERIYQIIADIEYKLQAFPTNICITCTFMDSSTTDCVAVVHQRISQLSSSQLMNIESSHKLNRSGDTAYGCIEGINLTDYQVGVIRGRSISSIIEYKYSISSTTCLGCVLGEVCAALLAVVMLVGIVLSVLIYAVKRYSSNQDGQNSPEGEVNMEMQRCSAYEVIQLSRQRVTMKDNPAYMYIGFNFHLHRNVHNAHQI